MNKEEMLSQLEGIREHCKIMIPQDEPDSVWRGDVEALDMAISELRQETNMAEIDHVKPLTLEELRQMDGEPVWVNIAGGMWVLVDTSDFVAWLDRGGFVALDRLSGKAYRQKPEEDKHEAD